MSVADNVAYALAPRGVGRAEQKARWPRCGAGAAGAPRRRYPREMSAGQQQRWRWPGRSPCALDPAPRRALRGLDKNCASTCRSRSSASSAAPAPPPDRHARPGGALSMADRVAVLNAAAWSSSHHPPTSTTAPRRCSSTPSWARPTSCTARLATGPGGTRVVARDRRLLPHRHALPTGRGWPPACGPSTSPSRPEGRGSTAWSRSACRSAPPLVHENPPTTAAARLKTAEPGPRAPAPAARHPRAPCRRRPRPSGSASSPDSRH